MFYTYHQNNSGGSFDVDDSVTFTVIIEAASAEEANTRAEDIGIYFDGCSQGRDCDCCGDRWYRQWKHDGEDRPLIYGEDPEKYSKTSADNNDPVCHIYYLDGHKKTYRK